jgi:hypothetical protein
MSQRSSNDLRQRMQRVASKPSRPAETGAGTTSARTRKTGASPRSRTGATASTTRGASTASRTRGAGPAPTTHKRRAPAAYTERIDDTEDADLGADDIAVRSLDRAPAEKSGSSHMTRTQALMGWAAWELISVPRDRSKWMRSVLRGD